MVLLEQSRLLFSDPGLCKRSSPWLERVMAGVEVATQPGPPVSDLAQQSLPEDAFISDAEPSELRNWEVVARGYTLD